MKEKRIDINTDIAVGHQERHVRREETQGERKNGYAHPFLPLHKH
jgi:hypothetical protein